MAGGAIGRGYFKWKLTVVGRSTPNQMLTLPWSLCKVASKCGDGAVNSIQLRSITMAFRKTAGLHSYGLLSALVAVFCGVSLILINAKEQECTRSSLHLLQVSVS